MYAVGALPSASDRAGRNDPELGAMNAVAFKSEMRLPDPSQAVRAISRAFVQDMGFARVHVFPYSVRAGTPAAAMPGQTPSQIKAERAKAMRQMAAVSARAFQEQFVGRTMDVLWESSRPGESGPLWSGLTGNYLRVRAVSSEDLANKIIPTELVALTEGGLQGHVDPSF